MPQVVIDSDDCPVFAWSQQEEYSAWGTSKSNWDIYSARLCNGSWEGPVRITNDPLPDTFHRLRAGPGGKVWLVWQGFRQGQSDIFLRSFQNGEWSELFRVTDNLANDWSADVAVSDSGEVTIVWDSYRGGDYDLYMRRLQGGLWDSESLVASTSDGEVNASAVYDREGRLWIAYETIGPNWGKDTGARSLGVEQEGTGIGAERSLDLLVLAGDRWREPEQPPVASVNPEVIRSLDGRDNHQAPRLYRDARGRIWLLFRQMNVVPETASWSGGMQFSLMPLRQRSRVYWKTYVTYYNGDHWIPATEMPYSRDRISSSGSAAPTPNGQFWVFWHTDNRHDTQPHLPQQNQVWSAVMTPQAAAPPPELVPRRDNGVKPDSLSYRGEVDDVQRLRSHAIEIDDQSYQLYRGDLHRHTEFSTDGGGRRDGSILDFFRYMIDAAAMDFGAITDHSAGGDDEYWWWLTQKVTEMHQIPDRYLSLFGYERTATYPNGHRNIIHPVRNIPLVKFHFRENVPEYWETAQAVSKDLADNDTELLYREVRQTNGISIPHTSATDMGTDWRDNDPTVEPVVEIFQGARASSEHEGATGSLRPLGEDAPSFRQHYYQPKGFVWRAWEKGYRLGVIASSDHGATHTSYAMVYAPTATREALIEAIRDRRTYAATDNILLEFWIGESFMGADVVSHAMPEIKIKVHGTAPVERISLVRNNQYIFQQHAAQAQVEVNFMDNDPIPGTSYYYCRVEQEDGHIAWSSPIWITLN